MRKTAASQSQVWVYGRYGQLDEAKLNYEAMQRGGRLSGSGVFLPTMERDLSFAFTNAGAAKGFAAWARHRDGVGRVETESGR